MKRMVCATCPDLARTRWLFRGYCSSITDAGPPRPPPSPGTPPLYPQAPGGGCVRDRRPRTTEWSSHGRGQGADRSEYPVHRGVSEWLVGDVEADSLPIVRLPRRSYRRGVGAGSLHRTSRGPSCPVPCDRSVGGAYRRQHGRGVRADVACEPGKYSRYVDTYERRGDRWFCVHACVWPLEG